MGAIDWQLKVRERIVQYKYEDDCNECFTISKEDYETALNEYNYKKKKLNDRKKDELK